MYVQISPDVGLGLTAAQPAGTKRYCMQQAEGTMAAHGWSSSIVSRAMFTFWRNVTTVSLELSQQQRWYVPPVNN